MTAAAVLCEHRLVAAPSPGCACTSRYGRVNFILALRLQLLKEVERLQQSLGVAGDVAYTCETAGHFFLYQVCDAPGEGHTYVGQSGAILGSATCHLCCRWCHDGRSFCPV